MRVMIEFQQHPQQFKYNDSMNAALVAGLTAAGLSSADLVGAQALPWTFGTAGRVTANGKRLVFSVTLSSPSDRFAEALAHLRPDDIRVASSNGDSIYLGGGVIKPCRDLPDAGVNELMVGFASPFLIPLKKQGRQKTAFHDTLKDVDLSAAVVQGLSHRAGRPLNLSISTDRLSMMTDLKKRLVYVRQLPNGKPLFYPAFSVPMTLRGDPQDVRFAFLAGIGAKTHAGFGCPILMS